MANPEHLAKLKEGVEVWNEWRKENPSTSPDLTTTNLTELSLCNYNLNRVNLSGSLLIDTDLSNSDLQNSNITYATLVEANLKNTKLTGADLFRADLLLADLSESDLRKTHAVGASFSDTYLYKANFHESDLSGAIMRGSILREANLVACNLFETDLTRVDIANTDFSNSILGRTIFIDVNLSNAIGLNTCNHIGPSTVDYQTIQASGTSIQANFLKGCGIPDHLIESNMVHLHNVIQFYSCFISYSSINQDFATRLYSDLQNEGVRCWFAPEDMRIGDKVRKTIEGAIRLHDKLVLILSETSIRSDWVEHEVTQALEREETAHELVLCPIRIDDAVMDTGFGWAKRLREAHRPTGRHIGDFTDWKNHDSYQKAFERLLRDLKA